MTENLGRALRRRVAGAFGRVRQIVVLADLGGRLVLVGHPTGAEIASAAMLLASVHVRLPMDHVYASPAIPGAALLRLLEHTDRGSILLAPVLRGRVPVGAILVEAERGHAFTREDLARLEATVESWADRALATDPYAEPPSAASS